MKLQARDLLKRLRECAPITDPRQHSLKILNCVRIGRNLAWADGIHWAYQNRKEMI